MSYRPICDFWLLARAKLKGGRKYYGSYLGGFPERARVLLGAPIDEPVLHVCGGMARYYPYSGGFGPEDHTLDLAEDTAPDFLQDAREPFPRGPRCWGCKNLTEKHPDLLPAWCNICGGEVEDAQQEPGHSREWAGILIDPPYSETDAAHYAPGSVAYPKPNILVKNAVDALPVGRRVGIIHYLLPACPKNAKFVAAVAVLCGHNNRIRCYSVFERTS